MKLAKVDHERRSYWTFLTGSAEVAGECTYPTGLEVSGDVDPDCRGCQRLLAKVDRERRSCWGRLTWSAVVAGEG